MQLKEKQNLTKHKIELVCDHPKILNKIISYLGFRERIDLSKCNQFFYKNIYFKTITEKIYRKLKLKEKTIDMIEGEDIVKKFELEDKNIEELFKTYIFEQKVPGKDMRNDIAKSLIFLENYIKIPMTNIKGPTQQNSNNDKPDEKPKFLSKLFSVIKSEFKSEIGFITENKNLVENNYIFFDQKEFSKMFEADKYVLETFNTDKSLNVKFEYNSSENIKEIINEFFACQLPQTSYQKFLSKICEIFPDLLYSSFLALNDIKNLQITIFALYYRYMKFKLKFDDLQATILDLHTYADSNKQIKELMSKAKNEIEVKYNNSLMTISELNNILVQKNNEIENINSKIKDDFIFTKKERDSLKGIFIEFKNFFIKIVSQEILN